MCVVMRTIYRLLGNSAHVQMHNHLSGTNSRRPLTEMYRSGAEVFHRCSSA
ncbi:hypothetical protein J2S41_006276 [Catenuloplanes atrovinosus]|uniref:Uncharacterized protein n=1 Tax=Catenuloplanes atrovinosus TaxID=137266 RepID=A0AAE3YW80_9ACTN|nr:hypothetical protein [Catenuloplanes atrovinosus]